MPGDGFPYRLNIERCLRNRAAIKNKKQIAKNLSFAGMLLLVGFFASCKDDEDPIKDLTVKIPPPSRENMSLNRGRA